MHLFDLHCDTLYRIKTEGLSVNSDKLQINPSKAAYLDKHSQLMAVWIPDNIRGIEAFEFFENCADIFKNYSNGKISAHMIRHLYATILYQESNHDVALVQEQLRHADVNTTIGTYANSDHRSYGVVENI